MLSFCNDVFLFNVSQFSWILTVENTDVVVGLLVGRITEAEALCWFMLLCTVPYGLNN